jgi:hypothetical protein
VWNEAGVEEGGSESGELIVQVRKLDVEVSVGTLYDALRVIIALS